MKKLILPLLTLMLLLSVSPAYAAPDIRDLLNGLAGGGASATDSTASSNPLGGAVGGLISGLLGNKELTEADLAGVYNYNEPAVSFKSENLLKKAGGAAMSAALVGKLAPYYNKAGLNNLVVTLTPEKNCEFAMGKMKLPGTFERDSTAENPNTFIFTFKAFGKMKISSITGEVQKSGDKLVMTFDASKLITLMNTVAKLTGRQSLQAAASLLNSYDGLNLGFELKKTADVTPADPDSSNK